MGAILLSIVAGWLLADLATGVVHWLEDRFGRESWPIIGRVVIAPNRLHHREPLAFTRGGFLERNWTAAAASLLLGGIAALALGPSLLLAVMVAAGCIANEVHHWAHRPDRAPGLVQAAQSVGLCQTRRHHAIHHAAPHDRHYCVLTNWLNPLLDRSGVWRLLEAPVPKRWIAGTGERP